MTKQSIIKKLEAEVKNLQNKELTTVPSRPDAQLLNGEIRTKYNHIGIIEGLQRAITIIESEKEGK